MMRICAAVVVFCLAACGSSESESCTVVDNGGSATISCPDGTSATVNDGSDGQDGMNGTNGTNGTSGTNGTNNHIVSTIFCQGALPGTPLFAEYSAALMASGDIFVHASVRDALVEIGEESFWAAGQNGAATANVIFEYDVAAPINGGWWQIGLNRSTLIQVVTYNDVDVSGGQDVWTKDPSECIVNAF